ncbi:unnamed protein product [Lasius platythorax]|uniref:Uncharacterized protein n=1 Tax=Lasius platythorax TaxID=488582 RepID=A0AAV2P4V0_9HYME
MDLSIYSREEKRERFQSASSWRESAGRTESMSERMGKERGWTARERSNFWAIAGQFRRVPNPPLFGGGGSPQ